MASTKEVMEVADTDLDGDELLKAKLCRKEGQTLLYVKVDEKITDLLQNSSETRTSSSWGTDENGDGHEYHHRNNYSDSVRNIMNNYFDDYGSDYARNGRGNVAFLRTEGIEEGIFFEINRPMTENNLRGIVSELKGCVDELKNAFLSDVAFISEVREVKVDKTVQTAFDDGSSE